MAASDSDVDTDRLETALDHLFTTHCGEESTLKSKEYCFEFCKLVEDHTGRWQVPLPQLKVLRLALCSFTTAASAFPAECQHIHYTLSSLALSFFELMLFFSREEFVEDPLKDIVDSFQVCHSRLLRHRNVYMQQVKQAIKAGGPWESPVLQDILREAPVSQADVEEYLDSEVPLFLELRVRYLQACGRLQEVMALTKSCLENRKAGKHLYFHQAYLTCLYKASLHDHLHKEMAEIDGREAVEIICNTERVEKDEVLLSLCQAFLTQKLLNGDMYYIWDLVFLWSCLYLRAHPSGQGFLAECHHLASTATNIRAIFPFIKVVTAELGSEGVRFCVELCARGLQVCGPQADPEVHSLLCKTIAFLLPHDLEVCQACSLLVFCQERSLEAYKTVCLLYMHPDHEQHPHNNPVPMSIRFYILQVLKERLCFDPEFWNLLTLRTRCLELISDNALKAAVLSEMREEEEKEEEEKEECYKEPIPADSPVNVCAFSPTPSLDLATVSSGPSGLTPGPGQMENPQIQQSDDPPQIRRKRRRKRRPFWRQQSWSEDEAEIGNDPEFKYNVKTTWADSSYSLRRTHAAQENPTSGTVSPKRQREYLSRCVKNQIFKRKGRKKRWLQGLPRLDQVHVVKGVKGVKINGRKRGRKPKPKLELSYPDNEVWLKNEERGEGLEADMDECPLIKPHAEMRERIGQEEGSFKRRAALEEKVTVVEGTRLHESRAEVEPAPSEEDPRREADLGLVEDPRREADLGLVEDPRREADLGLVEDPRREADLGLVEDPRREADLGLVEDPRREADLGLVEDPRREADLGLVEDPRREADLGLVGPAVEFSDCLIEQFHNYCLQDTPAGDGNLQPSGSTMVESQNGDTELEAHPVQVEELNAQVKGKVSWRDKVLRNETYGHLRHCCALCQKPSKGLNVVRHAISHLRGKKLICIFCGKLFKQFLLAKKHILDHIEEMCKDKPRSTETYVAKKEEVVNGNNRSKGSALKLGREGSIIKNLRLLLKRTGPGHKNQKSAAGCLWQQSEFTDEQVVIQEDVIIVKVSSFSAENMDVMENKEWSAEPGDPGDLTYHRCPSESCHKVFLKMNSTLLKHALKCHMREDKVLEKTFLWSNSRCTLCFRSMHFLQHYKDHMKLHDGPGFHFCYQLECTARFLTAQKLKEHVKTHQPLRAQCPFADCRRLFPSLQGLYDHEWRHYVPAPQKDVLDALAAKHRPASDEAPWKQKVKIEETWLQGGKGQKENSKAHRPAPAPVEVVSSPLKEDGESEAQAVTRSVADTCETMTQDSDGSQSPDNSATLYNGHAEQVEPAAVTPPAPDTTSPLEEESLNVKDGYDRLVLEELQIAEDKTSKAEVLPPAPFMSASMIRLPPCAYLAESELSMPKRSAQKQRKVKKAAWAFPEQVEANAEAKSVTTRRRCNKCLASFNCPEELEKHQALNNCSALFGFDSDDDES